MLSRIKKTCILIILFASLTTMAGELPLKIYILAGQSNMEGQGYVGPKETPGTLEYIVTNDPAKHYQFLVDDDGEWIVRDDVYIVYSKEFPAKGQKEGKLTAGFGGIADKVDDRSKIGPELGFGFCVGDYLENEVLLIKFALGGQSLGGNYRSPSSGGKVGNKYKEMMSAINEALGNLKKYVPDYEGQGYEIAGFAWHQGYNDKINATFTKNYAQNMANFIRDVRNDLKCPNLPFVIATTGQGPLSEPYHGVELGQMAVADPKAYPEFQGNVAVVDTRGGYEGKQIWRDPDVSPSGSGYHWNHNAEIYLNMGLSMGDAMLALMPGRCPLRLRAKGGANAVTLTWQNGDDKPKSVRVLRNGKEIASDLPSEPTRFVDSNVQPDEIEYTVQFTMPGEPAPHLSLIFNGMITRLNTAKVPEGIKLSWQNNMEYTGITVTRNNQVLAKSLPGNATTFIDTEPPAKGLTTYKVYPSDGHGRPAVTTLNFNLKGELGILDLVARVSINPATREPWKAGDQYRLAFVSSAMSKAVSSDLSTYDAFLTKLARDSGLGGNWKVIASSRTVDAGRHTGTSVAENGRGVATFLLDGTTIVAKHYQDLWDHSLQAPINLDERGNTGIKGRVFTGANKVNGLGHKQRVTIGAIEEKGSHWMVIYGAGPSDSCRLYAISDPLTVLDQSDKTTPTVIAFANDRNGKPVAATKCVTYTVTFSEAMKASTVDASDFGNAAGGAITVDRIEPTSDPAVYRVTVTPRESGRLQLRIQPDAKLTDVIGNPLDPRKAKPDSVIVRVTAEPALMGELGILDVTANDGINPATGEPWKEGDTYRLAFVSSALTDGRSSDLATYDAFLQELMLDAGIGGTWKVIGSSATESARAHTATDPEANGTGEAIFLLDGATKVADNYKDLWRGGLATPINLDEQGNRVVSRVFTGADQGKQNDRGLGGKDGTGAVTIGDCGMRTGNWMVIYSAGVGSSLPIYGLSDPLTIRKSRSR